MKPTRRWIKATIAFTRSTRIDMPWVGKPTQSDRPIRQRSAK